MKVLEFKGLVDKANGKICEHSNESVAYNPRTGKCWSVTRHPEKYNHEPSELQKTQMASFGTRGKVVGYFITLAQTEAKAGQTEKLDALVAMRDGLRLHSITAAANRLYDKERELITFEGKNYAPGYFDSTEQGGFGS